MKRLLFIILLIVIGIQLNAAVIPRLNLEIGETYSVETTMHINTSAQWPRRIFDKRRWQIKTIQYDPINREYKLELSLFYYKYSYQEKTKENGWQENMVCETGFNSISKLTLSELNKSLCPVVITINDQGKILQFDYSLCQNIIQVRNKVFIDKLEYELQRIFKNIPEEYEVITDNESEENSKYNLTVRDLSQYANGNSKIIIDTITGFKFREYHHFTVSETDIYGNLKSNGGKNSAIYFQKYMPVSVSASKVYDDHRLDNSDTINTTLKVLLPEKIIGEDSVLICIGEYDIVKVAIDTTRHFEIGLNLRSHREVYFEYPIKDINQLNDRKSHYSVSSYRNVPKNHFQSNNRPISSYKILIFPGDKLELEFDFSSNGEYYMKSISGLGKNEILNNSKDIDPTLALTNQFQKEYSKVNNKKNNFNYSSVVLVNNSLAIDATSYVWFLNNYLGNILPYQISNSSGINFSNLSSIREYNYLLGNVALLEPVKSYYFSSEIEKQIWRQPNSSFEEFSVYKLLDNEFNKTPLCHELKYISEKIKKLNVGDLAPAIKLQNFKGKTYNLKDFEGQVVVLNFFDFDKRTSSNFKPFFRNKEYYENEEVVCFNIFYGDKERCQEIANNIDFGISLFDDAYPNSSVFESYQLSKPNSKFIIDRNGRIVSIWSIYGYFGSNEIEKALAIPFESENEFPLWLRITLIALIGALISIVLTFIFYRSITKRRLRKIELNKKMRELELTAIRAQMNPHFMYNCLNSIQNLVQKNLNDEAHLYLSKFASLIRRVLNTSKKEEVSLGEELETIREYIDLEKLRFDFEFAVNIEKGIDPVSVFVPPMLLQPFVENALLHGLLPKTDNRVLKIGIKRKENKVCIVVEDNGVGRKASSLKESTGNGKGLQLSEERLQLLAEKYKTDFQLTIDDLINADGLPLGTRVSLCFEEE